ncbi:MAG: ATP-binding protein [Anaerolineae bacterium]
MRRLHSLPAQILIRIILPLILILIAVSLGSIALHQRSMRNMVAERDAQLAGQVASRILDSLRERDRVLQTVLRLSGRSAEIEQSLSDLHATVETFDQGLVIYDAVGTPLNEVPAALVARESEASDILRTSLENLGQPIYRLVSPAGVPPLLLMARADPATKRVVVGALSERGLNLPVLFDEIGRGRRAEVYLVAPDGLVIYHRHPDEIGKDVSAHSGVSQALRGEAGATFAHLPGEDEHVVGYAPVVDTGWALLVQEPWADVIVASLRYTLWAPLLVLIAAVASLVSLRLGLQHVVYPLRALGEAASKLSWGDFKGIEAPVGGIGEIEDLQRTLREVAGRVHRNQAGMQGYIAALTQAQEEERRRLARELHDETVQSLIALGQRVKILTLDWLTECESRPQPPACDMQARLAELSEMIWRCLDDVRALIRDLRPVYLEELGLVAALEMLVHSASSSNIKTTFRLEGRERRLPPDTELAVYRIAQAAVNNAVRHAKPQTISLLLEFTDDGALLTAEDDGTGFHPPERPGELALQGHFGLVGMYERAVRLGGHVTIRSTPGAGTQVTAFLPDPMV